MKQEKNLEINNRSVICNQAGRGYAGGFLQLFCSPAGSPQAASSPFHF
jgi:hypothetical protein